MGWQKRLQLRHDVYGRGFAEEREKPVDKNRMVTLFKPFGYWSFESGALVKILGLDDSSLKEVQYYPYDMVHWNENN